VCWHLSWRQVQHSCSLPTVRAADPISFTTFDVPGATANDITEAYFVPGINEDGVIVGTYGTATGGQAGFIRTPDGRISASIEDPNNPAATAGPQVT
jgi:hypothetical protein